MRCRMRCNAVQNAVQDNAVQCGAECGVSDVDLVGGHSILCKKLYRNGGQRGFEITDDNDQGVVLVWP
jgi:hypothetical protein